MKYPLVCLIFMAVIFTSCSDKYKPFKSHYQFSSNNGLPDYSSLDYWAAHPWKWDPSDSISKPLQFEERDSTVDVFFLHPTTFTSISKFKAGIYNAGIDDEYINAKTDYSSILYQASVFNAQCRVFAPRYRQANIRNFFIKDKEAASKAFAIAYEDIKTSFLYYLQHWNNGRPIIIASHSQGSLLAERLLKEFFEGTGLKNKLVAAYIIGWPVPKAFSDSIKMCEDSLQTGCICSWRTVRSGFIPDYLKEENGNASVTNPLSWRTDTKFVSRKMNRGSLLKKFNKIYKHTSDAQISNGLLYTRKPKFPWSFLFFSKNYHVGDINLYYINIRENVKQRIKSFRDQ